MIDIATYVVSDIHGEYELFIRLLEEICLKETDTLYVPEIFWTEVRIRFRLF